jgi:predicted nucleotidyltransferase
VLTMAETARLANAVVPVCRFPEAAETVRAYLLKVTRLVLDALGEDAVTSIVVSGSTTVGELTAVTFAGEGPLILSDVDVSVVMRDDSSREAARSARAELLRRFRGLPEAAGMLGGVELGVYSLRDLEFQTRKMGVMEMRTTGVTIWGDPAALRRLPAFGPEDIPRREAIALIYNRCLELLEAYYSRVPDDRRAPLRTLYAAAKCLVDVGTALAAYHGAYGPGYSRRLPLLESLLQENYPTGLGPITADALMEALAFWTRFKVDPDLTKVAERYGRAADDRGLSEAAAMACLEARRPLIEAWASLGTEGRGGASGTTAEKCTSMMSYERLRERLRGWKRLVAAGEVSPARAVRLARHGSPLQLLRLCAICAMDEAWGPEGGPLRPPARSFLEAYCPVPASGIGAGSEADSWRDHIARLWRRWTERFWS